MFETFLEFYVRGFAIILPAFVIGQALILGARAGFSELRLVRTGAVLAAILGSWYAAAALLAKAGYLMPPPTITDPAYILMFLFGGAILLSGLAVFTRTGQSLLAVADQKDLLRIQGFRVMGGVFLAGWMVQHLPWEFAIPAGVGDISAGLFAIWAISALRKNSPDARKRVILANLVGLADFATAVTLGIATSQGFLHILSHDAPNVINGYPLALFPAFFVPIFFAYHILSIRLLRQPALQTA